MIALCPKCIGGLALEFVPKDKWFEVTVLEEPSIARLDLILVRVNGEAAPRRISIERLEEQP